MKPRRLVAFLLAVPLVLLAFHGTASAQPGETAEMTRFDAQIIAELEAANHEAVAVFAAANAAREREDFAAAAELYSQVRSMAPRFVHATRRLCGVEAARGRRTEAIAICHEALAAKESAENLSALAMAILATSSSGVSAGQGEMRQALAFAERGAALAPDRATAQSALCFAAAAAEDLPQLKRCSSALAKLAPDAAESDFYAALSAGSEGRESEARDAIERARAHGLPEKAYATFLTSLEEARPPIEKYAGIAGRAVAIWLGGFALLLVLGAILSRATLRAARRLPESPDGHARGLDAKLRRIYRAVLGVCCAYYYASLPLLAIAVAGLGAGLIYAFFAMGRIPIQLVLVIGAVVLFSLVAIVRSIFVRTRDEDPGMRLKLKSHPKLAAALDEAAERIGTRRVDNVYLTPGTEVAVTERGGLVRRMRGGSERCLILGAGVLDGMTARDFKSVLAHEYGHFKNEDTAGGGFALAVRRSLLMMTIHLIQGGVATWYNPAWWFVRGFERVFIRISHGASRLQEVLADRWATFAYGSASFERGLRHVVARSVRFDAHVDATLEEVLRDKHPLENLYAYTPTAAPAADIDAAVEKAINAEPSPYDSHPSPASRIAWMRELAAPGPETTAEDAAPAWELFGNRAKLELRMTARLRTILAGRGIEVEGPAVEALPPL